MQTWPGGTGRRYLDLRHLRADPRRLDASLFNSVWLLAFGTPLARRFGAARFLAFCAVTAAAGALAHLMTHFGQMVPMVGASGERSPGPMAAAMRFAFQRGGPLRFGGSDESLSGAGVVAVDSLRDPRMLAFLAVWFGLNLLFGIGLDLDHR